MFVIWEQSIKIYPYSTYFQKVVFDLCLNIYFGILEWFFLRIQTAELHIDSTDLQGRNVGLEEII